MIIELEANGAEKTEVRSDAEREWKEEVEKSLYG